MSSVILLILLFAGLATLSLTLSDPRCQPGWAQFGSRCYKVFPTPTDWDAAEKNCVNIGGHLASVHNIDEYTFIQAEVLNATGSNAVTWLGATDVVQESVWVWTDGSAFDYKCWLPGQPDNNGQNEHCLHMNFEVTLHAWNDAPCEGLYPSACAKAAFYAINVSVIRLKIMSKEDLLKSDIEKLVQQVKQKLMGSEMPSNTTLRLKNIYKKPK